MVRSMLKQEDVLQVIGRSCTHNNLYNQQVSNQEVAYEGN